MEKIFHVMQGKISSSGARRRKIVQRGVTIALTGYNWYGGGQYFRGGVFGDWIALVGDSPLPFFCFPTP